VARDLCSLALFSGRIIFKPHKRFEEVMAYLREELRKATGGEGPTQGSLFGP